MALLASAVSGSAIAQSTVMYQPAKNAKDQGLTIHSWGSGTISETDETAFEGVYSVRISTHNYFQGGILGFSKPFDINKEYNVKTNLLKVTYKVADSGVMGGAGRPGAGFGGDRKGGPGFPGGNFPGAGFPGGAAGGSRKGGGGGAPAGIGAPGGAARGGFPGGGAGFPGGSGGFPGGAPQGGRGFGGGQGLPGGAGPGGRGFGGASTVEIPELKTFRVILTTSDGKKSEAYIPIESSAATDTGWKTVSIPLEAISGLDRTDKVIQSVAFGANTISTFYVGDIRIVDDSTPIRGEINGPANLNLALGDEIVLSATGFGGSSVLKYTWDFDARDGIQVDAEGQSITHKFRKEGNYTVTLTVSDLYGLKPAYTTTMKVTVNP